jgi:O-antigen/teichoic acid export membrane protein
VKGRFRQLLSDVSFYTVGSLFRRGISIVTLPVFTRYLSMQEYGLLAIIGTFRELLGVVFQLGIPNSADRFYFDCQTDAERRRLLGTLLIFLMGSSLAASVLLVWFGAGIWGRFVPDIPFHPYVSLTIVTVYLSGMHILPRSLFRVTNRVPLYTGLTAVYGGLTAALSIALVAFWKLGVLGTVLAYLIMSAIFFVVFLVYMTRHVEWGFSWGLIRDALAFGLPDIPVRVSTWALKLADRLVLQRFLPLSVVGLYSVGYTLGSAPLELFSTAAAAAILPFFYRTAKEESEASSKRIFAVVAAYDAAVFGFLGLATILFSGEAIAVFATSRYRDAEAVVPFVVWASICQALIHVPARGIYLMKRTGRLPLVFLGPALLNIGLNFLLIPPLGMMGAAWATLLAYPAMLGLTLWLAQKVYPIPYDYVRMAKPLLLVFVLSLLKEAVPSSPLLLTLVLKTLLLASFPVLLLASGFVTSEERRAFGRLAFRPASHAV